MLSKKIHRANNPVSKTLTLVVIATFLFSTSCMSTRTISTRVIKPQPDTPQNELKKVDRVSITTNDGGNFDFRIVDVSSKAIIGYKLSGESKTAPQQQILFSNIAMLQPSGEVVLAGVVVIAVIVVVLVTLATSSEYE